MSIEVSGMPYHVSLALTDHDVGLCLSCHYILYLRLPILRSTMAGHARIALMLVDLE